jgi:hypothetical protein
VILTAVLVSVAGCAHKEPEVVCDPAYIEPPPQLECGAAVETATSALGDEHPRIVRIAFTYGHYCPPGWRCPPGSSEFGVVYLDFGGLTEDVFVEVTTYDGPLRVWSGPTPGSR